MYIGLDDGTLWISKLFNGTEHRQQHTDTFSWSIIPKAHALAGQTLDL